tara:strand:- start:99 stop:455 length:357 start_codon:yes stop_codon:yes gene_type:complete
MKFIERIKLIEKRKLNKEAMGNRQSDDDELPDGPKAAPQATTSDNEAEAELDAEDTMEMSEPGKVDASKKRRVKKEDLDPSGGKIEMKEKSTCTPERKALANSFKKMDKTKGKSAAKK